VFWGHVMGKPAISPLLSLDPSEDDEPEDSTGTWRLIRDEFFDRIQTDEELLAVVERLAARLSTPYSELLRRLLGMDVDETEGRALFRHMLEHRRELSEALGRPVHVRVAALDLFASGRGQGAMHFVSRPIVVSPSLLERALEEARSDALTGLPQHGHFLGLLRHELRQRNRRRTVVVFLDLDGMKGVNDVHGHARGDEVLRALASTGRTVLRHGDVLARIGGDEFALMLVDVTREEASTVVGRLRDRFERSTAALGTSFSAGIAIATEKEAAEHLLERADAAMYRDKRERALSRKRTS
jgi:diguanylate cyclase (GGDEF)-like protein